MSSRKEIKGLQKGKSLLVALSLLLFGFLLLSAYRDREDAAEEPVSTAREPGRLANTQTAVSSPHPSGDHHEQIDQGLGLRQGDRLTYDYEARQLIKLVDAGDESNQTVGAFQSLSVAVELNGQMNLDVLSELTDGDGWMLALSFSSFSAKRRVAQIDDRSTEEITDEMLRSSLLLEVLKNGNIRKSVTDGLTMPETVAVWKDVLSQWRVALPLDTTTNSWEQIEDDATGLYLARYTHEGGNNSQHLRKRKMHYIEFETGSGSAIIPEAVLNGFAAIELDPYQKTIIGEESSEIKGPGMVAVISHLNYSLRLRSSVNTPVAATEVEQAGQQMAAATNPSEWGEVRLDATMQSSPTMTPLEIDDTIRALISLIQSGDARSGRHVQLASDLIWAIRGGLSEATTKIVRELANNPAADEYTATLTGILGAAGTPDAQAALLAIIGSEDWPADLRDLALQALVQVTEPIPEMDDFLMNLSSGESRYADGAFMILAAMGERLRDIDPARREMIADYIEGRVNATDTMDEDQLDIVLGAIGNIGPSEVPDIVSRVWSGENPALRARAVASLERVYSQKAFEIISSAANDANESIRAAAIDLLADPDRSGGFDVLSGMLLNDPSDAIRITTIPKIMQWNAPGNASVETILKRVLSEDPSPEVRETAALHLAFLRGDDARMSAILPSDGLEPGASRGRAE